MQDTHKLTYIVDFRHKDIIIRCEYIYFNIIALTKFKYVRVCSKPENFLPFPFL